MNARFNHWEYEQFFSVPLELFVDDPSGYNAMDYPQYMPESERWFLQDYSLWKDISDFIRQCFEPSELTRLQLAEYTSFLESPNKCALHIRRDERLLIPDTHPMPPTQYYVRAIERLGGLDAYNYWIFSDDINWCVNEYGSRFNYVRSYPRHQDTYRTEREGPIRDHLDMLLMKECVQHVIPNSTYSWWGAYLANKNPPIYPAIWYGSAFKHIDASLQFPEDWIKLG